MEGVGGGGQDYTVSKYCVLCSTHITHSLQIDEAVFGCPQLFQEHQWHHIAVVINKGMRGRAKVTLFVNSQLQETQNVGSTL